MEVQKICLNEVHKMVSSEDDMTSLRSIAGLRGTQTAVGCLAWIYHLEAGETYETDGTDRLPHMLYTCHKMIHFHSTCQSLFFFQGNF